MTFPIITSAIILLSLGAGQVLVMYGLPHIAVAVCTFSMLAVAAGLYRLRSMNRLMYGLFELFIALGFFYFLVLGMLEAPREPMTMRLLTSRALTMFAAVYFMVRAFDNIGQGLTGRAGDRWKQVFEKKPK